VTFAKYSSIQLAAYLIDMGVFLLAVGWSPAGPLVANLFAKVAAGIFAFFLHRQFTFEMSDVAPRAHAYKYFLLLSLNIPIASGALALFLLLLPHVVLSKVLADIACVILTYGLSKHFVFTRSHVEDQRMVKK
jgi:putative flippase GtrA